MAEIDEPKPPACGPWKVVEGHSDLMIDVSHRRVSDAKNVLARTHVPRLADAGVEIQFLTIAQDSPILASDRTWPDYLREGLHVTADFYAELSESEEGHFFPIRTKRDVQLASPQHIGFVLHSEGAGLFEGSLGIFRAFFELGLRSLGLTWNGVNEAADGCMQQTGRGLSDFGFALVRECNRLGVLIDVSHLSDHGVFDVLAHAAGPVIASHSNARAVHGHPRNLTDDQIRGIAATGGTVGLCAYPPLVSDDHADTTVMLRHLDHLVEVAGIDHVAFGGDFLDYVHPSWFDSGPLQAFKHELTRPFPKGLEAITDLPRFAQAIVERGYSLTETQQIMGSNLQRVLTVILPNG